MSDVTFRISLFAIVSRNKIFICLLNLVLMVMVSPISNFFDVALDLYETVDTDFEESSCKKECEDEKDELFSQTQGDQTLAKFKRNTSKMAVNLQHAPPLLAVVSPPPEC